MASAVSKKQLVVTLRLCYYCSGVGLGNITDSMTHFLFGRSDSWPARYDIPSSPGHHILNCPVTMKLQNSQAYSYLPVPAGNPASYETGLWLYFTFRPGQGGGVCTSLPSSQAQKIIVEMFSFGQLLKAIITAISLLLLHVFLSASLFPYLVFFCGLILVCQLLLLYDPHA